MADIDFETGIFIAGMVAGVILVLKVSNFGLDKIIARATNGNGKGKHNKTEALVRTAEIAKDCTETKGIVVSVRDNQIKTNEINKAGYQALVKEQKATNSQMKSQGKTLIEIRDLMKADQADEKKAQKALKRLKG